MVEVQQLTKPVLIERSLHWLNPGHIVREGDTGDTESNSSPSENTNM